MYCAKCSQKVTFSPKLHKWVHSNGEPTPHITSYPTAKKNN